MYRRVILTSPFYTITAAAVTHPSNSASNVGAAIYARVSDTSLLDIRKYDRCTEELEVDHEEIEDMSIGQLQSYL